MTKPTLPDLDEKYAKQVAGRLTEVLGKARKKPERESALTSPKIVVFSDHHKGARDGADDFQRCERAYSAALGYYLEMGFQLFVLGDAEELWEETPAKVVECYSDVLRLEAEFQRPGRGGLVRFFGNHDDDWEKPRKVKRHLSQFFGELEVRESLLLPLSENGVPVGELFFVHGHQGTTESDKYGRLARLPVRYLWRPLQRKLGYSATTPASEYGLRGTHDRAMFEWVSRQPRDPPLVLISGHTHRPVFSTPAQSRRPLAVIEKALAAAPDGPAKAALRAELEHGRAIERDLNAASVTVEPPCYFNTGCCSFPDGDVTGLEIEDGNITLVRWPDDQGSPRRKQLGHSLALRNVFSDVAGKPAAQASIREYAP